MPETSGTRGLAGRVAIVTGAASGIGLASATELAAHGARVMMADINVAGEQAASSVEGMRFRRADLSRREECYALVTETVDEFGRLDILVNNAGMQKMGRVEAYADQDWDRMLSILLTAPFTLIKAAIPHMYAQNWGRIVNIASALGLRGAPFKPAYVAAKHGLVGLTKSVALEAVGQGVTCNAVCPGWVRTPLVEGQIQDQARNNNISPEEVMSRILLARQPRLIEPSEIADVVAFLCSDAAATITGTTISPDLGTTAQ
jgi:3-hydroxybutyrate dehydrogenase